MSKPLIYLIRHFIILAIFVFVSCLQIDPVFANESISANDIVVEFEPPVVTGDDEIDAFVGTGGLLLPSSFSGSQKNRHAVANCLNCVWRFSVYCAQDSQEMCAHAAITCPVGKIRYRIRFSRIGETPMTIGSVCWGSSKPMTREKMGLEIKERVARYLPDLEMGITPSPRTITMVPIIVWSGQKPEIRLPHFRLGGFNVSVIASATWLWSWGDGTRTWTRQSGKRFPSTQLTHQFRRAGTFNVSVRSYWFGQYLVSGIGKFPAIGGPIEQFDSQFVSVVNQEVRLSDLWNSKS